MTKTWMKTVVLTTVAGVTAFLAACDLGPELEVRTFQLENLRGYEAASLIEPYVYTERRGTPGYMSTIEGAITVRETTDNLEQISRVLADFDLPRADTRLHFQLIEADGFTDSDPKIAAVESELRKIFQFRGYRLAGEAFVVATDGSSISQGLQASDGLYQISGELHQVGPGSIRLEAIRLWSESSGQGLETTVNIRPGQTLVLGSSPKEGSTATLLLTVRAEEGPGPA